VEKIQVLMPMEIHLTSPRSCFILHGTQLRIPWHVLLQIACICIMRRGCPTEVFFGLLPMKAQGLQLQPEMVQGFVFSSFPWGQKELLIPKRPLVAMLTDCTMLIL
jgi:hypothetical protein